MIVEADRSATAMTPNRIRSTGVNSCRFFSRRAPDEQQRADE